MGASLITRAAMATQPSQETVVHAMPRACRLVMEVPCSTPPDYHFDEFVHLCEECQRRKRVIEAKLQSVMQKMRITSNFDEHYTAEQKHYIMQLISRFRQIQEEQNVLVEREKIRLFMMKNELGSKQENVRKLRRRLKYVISLNKDHENVISNILHGGNLMKTQSDNSNELRQRVRSAETEEIRL